jgi:hypothetical protein
MEFILFFSSLRKKKKETPAHIEAHLQARTSQGSKTKGLQKSYNFAYAPVHFCYFSALI